MLELLQLLRLLEVSWLLDMLQLLKLFGGSRCYSCQGSVSWLLLPYYKNESYLRIFLLQKTDVTCAKRQATENFVACHFKPVRSATGNEGKTRKILEYFQQWADTSLFNGRSCFLVLKATPLSTPPPSPRAISPPHLLHPKILGKERKAEKRREEYSRRPTKKSNKIPILKIQRSIGHMQPFNTKWLL